jgi:hypothetical protein
LVKPDKKIRKNYQSLIYPPERGIASLSGFFNYHKDWGLPGKRKYLKAIIPQKTSF